MQDKQSAAFYWAPACAAATDIWFCKSLGLLYKQSFTCMPHAYGYAALTVPTAKIITATKRKGRLKHQFQTAFCTTFIPSHQNRFSF